VNSNKTEDAAPTGLACRAEVRRKAGIFCLGSCKDVVAIALKKDAVFEREKFTS